MAYGIGSGAVMVIVAGNSLMYQRRKKKGGRGIKGSPLEAYEGAHDNQFDGAKP